MKLSELKATFVGMYEVKDGRVSFWENRTLSEAQGVLFDCPLCQGHSVLAWFKTPATAPAVPADAFPRPGRWGFTGTSLDDLTLTPSIDLSKGEHAPGTNVCLWHGHVTNGDAQ